MTGGSETVVEGPVTSETTTETTTTAAHHSVVVDIDLWVFISLMLACLVINIRHRVKVPTSALLMLVGIVLRITGQYLGMVELAVKTMDAIEAETILLIFLPTLIFECAFSLDWYTFRREIGQILLLATTAVFIASILTAVCIRYVLGFSDIFGWYAALMLGAILSATDHVSVVAQLKEVNADERLETLIQGETLVNEGSVIVIFTAMLKGAIESTAKPDEIVSLFFRLSLGGIALGLGFGVTVSLWLRRLVDRPVLETLLTFITTYLLFFTADATSLHFSGAIGTVTFGLYMSAYGKTLISPASEETVHEFWEILGTCVESLIFILGGMLMGHFITDFQSLEFSDIAYLFALFALLHVVRAVTVILHWPLLRLMGYGCSVKEMVVLIVGALKGTISIALALMVFHEEEFSERLRDLVLFWSVGVSALSVTLDSMILHFTVKLLGLESMTDVEENMLMSVTTSILATTNQKIIKMKESEEYGLVNWNAVVKSAGPETLFFNMLKATKNGKRLLQSKLQCSTEEIMRQFNESVNISDEDIIFETRKRFYCTLKGLYWDRFEKGMCFGPSALILMESANRGLDSVDQPMNDWVGLEKRIYPHRKLHIIRTLARLPLIGNYFRRQEYSIITEAYDVSRSFINAHHEAEEVLDDMEIDIKKEIFEEVMKEPHVQIELAKEFLASYIVNVYPEVYIFVQTKQASYTLLLSEQKAIEEAYEDGVITELEHSELSASVDRNITEIRMLTTPKAPTIIEMLKSCSLFIGLPNEYLEQLAANCHEEVMEVDSILFQDKEEIKGIFVVIKGRVREMGKDYEEECLPGDIVGIQYLLPYFARTQTTAQALIKSTVVFISTNDIKELMIETSFENKVWVCSAKKAISVCRSSFGVLASLDSAGIASLFNQCTLSKYCEEEKVPLENGSILLNGKLSNGSRAFAFIPGHAGQIARAVKSCVLLHFSKEFAAYVRSSTLDMQRTVSKFEHQSHDKTPRAKVSARPIVDARRGSLLERVPSSISPLPPVKAGKYRKAQVAADESPEKPSQEQTKAQSTLLARLRNKHQSKLNSTDIGNQNSENKDEDSKLLAPSSERGSSRHASKK